jgi:hypothetical protein
MRKTFTAVLLAGSISLGACATNERDEARLEGAGTGAVVGGALGAGVGALAGDAIAGAAIGAGIGGLAGAVWADANNDGRVDGYRRNGQYYPGEPAGYDPATGRACSNVLGTAAGGAALGGAAGAGVGAATGLGVLEGAVAGALVGGVAGAIWADANNDGCVDGYQREGQYYPGVPQQQQYYQQPVVRRGERG